MKLSEYLVLMGSFYDVINGWYTLIIADNWHIVLIVDKQIKRTKKIGKTNTTRVCYFERAFDLCCERNKKDGYFTTQNIPTKC